MQDHIITMQNINCSYGGNKIFNNFNLNITNGSWLSIIGPNASGKSTLIKILTGLLDYEGYINIGGYYLNTDNIISIRRKMGVVFDNPDNQFVGETVKDDLAFALENLQYDHAHITREINWIADLFKLRDLFEIAPQNLTNSQKQKVAIASALITKPQILILDEALANLEDSEKNEVLTIIKEMQKNHQLTVINITHDLDDTLYSDRIVILNKGDIYLDGDTLAVLTEEKKLNHIGLELPFMVQLSINLQLYGLIDHIILDMDEMVNTIWK